MYTAAKCIDDILDRVLLTVFILVTLIGAWFTLDSAYVFYSAAGNTILPARLNLGETESALKELSSDAVAWLHIDGTNIDYPVMQGEDNSEYLNKDPYGEYTLSGSIFLDCRNDGAFNDHYSILYGHHMSHNYMFGALDQFEKESFFNSHQSGTLTYGGNEYELNIFSFDIFDAMDMNIFEPGYHTGDLYQYIVDRAKFSREHGNGRILALSTCREPGDTARTVVCCEIADEPNP